MVELHGDSTYDVKQSKVAIPTNLLTTVCWTPLFAFLANHIHQFLQANDAGCDERPRDQFRRLGFTFSFTVHQTSISTGTLVRWDKGFDIPSAIGRDPCQMLQEMLDALRAPVLVTALVNDSVATYMAQQYVCGGRAVLGAIFGTGTNGAYVEDLAAVGKIHDSTRTSLSSIPPPNDRVAINTEWGSFDDHEHVLPAVQYDLDLDRSDLHPGEQRYEKMLSGMYLGELFRRAVLAAYQPNSRHLAIPKSSPLLHEWHVPTSLLSLLVGDYSDGYTQSRGALQSAFAIDSLPMEEVQGIRRIADAVSKRAGRLAGIAISAVILKTECLQMQLSYELPEAYSEKCLVSQGKGLGQDGSGVFACTRVYRLLSTFVRRPGQCLADLQRCLGWKESLPPNKDSSKRDQPIFVGLDGTLAASSPDFISGIRSTFRDVAGIGEKGDQRIRLHLLQDGSTIGTALIAQAAS